MEPLSTTAIAAIGTVFATKALEKTGEKVAEAVWDKTGQFLVTLKKHSPHTVTAIEKAPDQPFDYGKAVLEVESAAKADPKLKQDMQELAAAAKAQPIPGLDEFLRDIKEVLKSQSSTTQIVEKINNYAQRDINIKNQNNNF